MTKSFILLEYINENPDISKLENSENISKLSKLLLLDLIYEYYGIQYKPKDLTKSVNGKPFISNSPIYFSISHSNNLIAIIISKEKCGIDIELQKDRPSYILPYNHYITKDNKQLSKKEFYKEWTKLETYYKYLDTSESLRDIIIGSNIRITHNEIELPTLNKIFNISYTPAGSTTIKWGTNITSITQGRIIITK